MSKRNYAHRQRLREQGGGQPRAERLYSLKADQYGGFTADRLEYGRVKVSDERGYETDGELYVMNLGR